MLVLKFMGHIESGLEFEAWYMKMVLLKCEYHAFSSWSQYTLEIDLENASKTFSCSLNYPAILTTQVEKWSIRIISSDRSMYEADSLEYGVTTVVRLLKMVRFVILFQALGSFSNHSNGNLLHNDGIPERILFIHLLPLLRNAEKHSASSRVQCTHSSVCAWHR